MNITVEKNDSDSPIFQQSEIPETSPDDRSEAAHPRHVPRQRQRKNEIALEQTVKVEKNITARAITVHD